MLVSESEMPSCDDFAAVLRNFFQCGPFFRGDSSLRLDSCSDFPSLNREVLVAGAFVLQTSAHCVTIRVATSSLMPQ